MNPRRPTKKNPYTVEVLESWRVRADLNHKEFAALIGLTERWYQNIRKGKDPIRLIHCLALERALMDLAARKKNYQLVPVHVLDDSASLTSMEY